MCGRYAQFSKTTKVGKNLHLPEPTQNWKPRYNIAPGTWIPGIRHEGELNQNLYDGFWWGFRPHWAGDTAPEPINAKAENLESSRYFKGAFHHHRCLIPADGWYEWKPVTGGKQPFFIHRVDREPLFFAGIWETRPDGMPCCAIITEPARSDLRDLHDRMPLVLDEDCLSAWLDPVLQDQRSIRGAIHRLDPDDLAFYPVTSKVNRSSYDGPDILESAI